MGCPIRTSTDHSSVTSSLWLFAGSHVLHRLWTPRHPPCALMARSHQPDAALRFPLPVALGVPLTPLRLLLPSTNLPIRHSLQCNMEVAAPWTAPLRELGRNLPPPRQSPQDMPGKPYRDGETSIRIRLSKMPPGASDLPNIPAIPGHFGNEPQLRIAQSRKGSLGGTLRGSRKRKHPF
jgi:hypothetical protein